MKPQRKPLSERYVTWIENLIGHGAIAVVKALTPLMGVERAARAKEHCQWFFHLYPHDLVFDEDYLLAPTGTLIRSSPEMMMLVKLANGQWKAASLSDAPHYPSAHVCQWGPHWVIGWGQTWA
ncbi:hypothetical protein [Corynebacterium mastitidis]|uniref:hypothetical protein n=1 Tax=Corynebacterium mastitidis TaxID=161890 RepID=UPI00035EB906|nr:hypothetical protein [Corynebacterium mastitidis]